MLIRCLRDHQVAQSDARFEAGKVYDVDGEYGRRLLQDFGRGSRAEARHQGVDFAPVSVEGSVVDLVVEGEPVKHTVTADEAYSGPVVKWPLEDEAPVDHSHQSQSEPEQPPFGDKLEHDGDNAEADRTTATQGGSGTGAPVGQVGSGQPGDTLSSDLGGGNVPDDGRPMPFNPAPPSDVPGQPPTPQGSSD